MPAGGVHHVDLVVSSIERSLPFYRELLAPLGYHRLGEIEGEQGETVWYLSGDEGLASIGLREAPAPTRLHDRYELGLHHLAVTAPSRAAVDERHAWLRERATEIESEPREYGYAPGYYAVFFYDPDGMKLEIVHVPDPESRREPWESRRPKRPATRRRPPPPRRPRCSSTTSATRSRSSPST